MHAHAQEAWPFPRIPANTYKLRSLCASIHHRGDTLEKGTQTIFATTLGAVLLLVGVIGLFTDGMLLGLFGVNGLHNAVHLLSGAIGLWAGVWGGTSASRMFNRIFGVIYGLVAVLGLLGVGVVMSLLNLNAADNWLHVLIAAASLVVGFGKWD